MLYLPALLRKALQAGQLSYLGTYYFDILPEIFFSDKEQFIATLSLN
jgi:hypothetical protein